MASKRRSGHDRAIAVRAGRGPASEDTATEGTVTDATLAAYEHVYLAIYTVVRITSSAYLYRVTQKNPSRSTCDVSTLKDFTQVTLNFISWP
jgi:hypothetical protein